MTEMLHVFEKAGLGKAPYAFLGMQELRGPLDLGNGCQVGSPGQPMGSCQYCSTGIAYLFWLQSADGKKFYVGSDCIFKSGDAGLRRIIDPIVQKHKAEMQESRSKALVALFEAFLAQNPSFWAQDTRPHPHSYYASLGKTMGDYNRFCYENAGLSTKAARARQFLIAANVPLPATAKRGGAKRKPAPGVVPVVREVPGMFGGIRIIDLGD